VLPGRLKSNILYLHKMKNILRTLLYIIPCGSILLFIASCGNEPEKPAEVITAPQTELKTIPTPDFNSDSAYAFIKAQVDFGPRVPGTPAHGKCAEYLVKQLKSYGFETIIPGGQTVKTYDGKQFMLKNIIASFKPEMTKRILLCSHWDTRHIAESDDKNKDKPGDGANDGASGVGVALEVARQVSKANPAIGVDIIYFDLEDYGTQGSNESWCLGSGYWATHLHKPGYVADYGILLDMVGGPDATFVKEGISMERAPSIVEKVWKAANDIGYGNFFVSQTRNFVGIDDHVPVNDKANIPCIDIIQYNQVTGGFPDYHHTHKDNMEAIDKKTLKAVGQTLLEVIYRER
jgi:glutaminyl-peptide cyclotransferase